MKVLLVNSLQRMGGAFSRRVDSTFVQPNHISSTFPFQQAGVVVHTQSNPLYEYSSIIAKNLLIEIWQKLLNLFIVLLSALHTPPSCC